MGLPMKGDPTAEEKLALVWDSVVRAMEGVE